MLLLSELDVREVKVFEERSKIFRLKFSLPFDVDSTWSDFTLKKVNQVDVRRRAWQVSQEDGSPCVLAGNLDTIVKLKKR